MSLWRHFFRNKRITLLGCFVVFLAGTILFSNLPNTPGLTLVASLGTFVTGIVLAWRFAKTATRKSIWSLRNRLIATYVFIGFVPLILVLVLAGLAGYIFAGQTALYLVSSELDRTIGSLGIPARVIAADRETPARDLLDQVAPFIHQRFPKFEVIVRRGSQIVHYPADSTLQPPDDNAPDYSGLALKDGVYHAWSRTRQGDLTVDVLAGVDSAMLGNLVPHLGRVDIPGERGRLAHQRLTAGDLRRREVNAVPPPSNQFDYAVSMFSAISVSDWPSGKRLDSSVLFITTRPSALLSAIFGEKLTFALGFLYIFLGLAVLFLLVECISAFIGASLARSITRAMQDIYRGTQNVAAGDFSHRIQVRGHDQLAAVGESFNAMTERLERLVVVEKEKERLQSELEIAREVQAQLFPRSSPEMNTVEITGLCRPARMVSGDYYDFLCLQETNLAVAIGDVAGKGISAALLMASIQSIMRTQLSAFSPVMAATANGASRQVYSTSSMVSQLNRQLYLSTSPEKYATFLFGVYDERDCTFTYTNAGHLPPILIRRGESIMLEVTGTVVGAFPCPVYEEQKIVLEPGDLLVSYTDGITEPENEYGEEFGAERLVELLLKHQKLEAGELVDRVMDAVCAWTSAPELPDDMTLVLARRTS